MKRLLPLLLLLVAAPASAATGTVMPMPWVQWFTDVGTVCSGCKLYTYAAGTTTPQATYTDNTLATPNANPVVADSAGRMVVYLSATGYKFILKTSADVTIRTQDNVTQVPQNAGNVDVTGIAGEALTAGQAVYLSDGSGAKTAGDWYKTDSTNTYSSSAAAVVGFAVNNIASLASGSVRILGSVTGLSSLIAGTRYYVSATPGGLTSSAPTNSRFVGEADTTTSLVASPNPNVPDASVSISGVVNITTQSFAGVKTFASAVTFAGSPNISAQPTFTMGTGSTANATGSVNVNTTSTANVGAAEQDLLVFTLAAGTLGADGKGVRITAWGEFSADTDAKKVLLKCGSTTLTAVQFSGNAALVRWHVVGEIIRTSATAQVLSVVGFVSTVGGGAGLNAAGSFVERTTAAETMSGTVSVGIRADGDNNGNIVQKALLVEVIG